MFFSILFNGSQTPQFELSCGLRQGDPLLPYLFIIMGQAFSLALNNLASAGICRGIVVSTHSLHISHLLFADDYFLFSSYNQVELWNLKWILNAYCNQAG